jgi:hypothetical protein
MPHIGQILKIFRHQSINGYCRYAFSNASYYRFSSRKVDMDFDYIANCRCWFIIYEKQFMNYTIFSNSCYLKGHRGLRRL